MNSTTNQPAIAIRSSFLDFIDDPFYVSEAESVRYIADGLLIVENGVIADFGNYEDLQQIPIKPATSLVI